MSDTNTKATDPLEAKIALLTARLEKVSVESLKTAMEAELKEAKEEQARRAASVMKQVSSKLATQVDILNEIRTSERQAKELVSKIDEAYDAFLGENGHPDAGNIVALRTKLTPIGVSFTV